MSERVKNYSQYNATLRLYEDFSTLNVFFYYQGTLPEGTQLRVTHVDGVAGDYGAATVGLANLPETDPNLLNAKIISTSLSQCNQLSLVAETPDGTALFQLNYTLTDVTYPSGTQYTPNKDQQNNDFTVTVPGFEPPSDSELF